MEWIGRDGHPFQLPEPELAGADGVEADLDSPEEPPEGEEGAEEEEDSAGLSALAAFLYEALR